VGAGGEVWQERVLDRVKNGGMERVLLWSRGRTEASRVMVDFDNRARQWDTHPAFVERANRLAEAIRARVPLERSMHALDYGCGTGLLSFPLKDLLGHITLQDTSPGMLEVLREKIAAQGVDNMTVREGDLAAGPLPTERYTLIYTSMTLHHVPDTDGILAAFRSLLGPGGHLCVADLDTEDGSFHGPGVEVHHGFDRADLAWRVERAGFEEVQFETVFEIAREQPEGEVQRYPVFLMVARAASEPAAA
jgi:2-polyprenyl-3-methyl-5-hydroxy-6-metoxy-1,4-benzoquinol methylase